MKELFGRSQLTRNMLSGVLASGLQSVSNLVGYPLYIRFLGYEQYGIWLTLATLISLMQLGIAGIGPAISQLVAEALARDETDRLASYVTWAGMLTLGITALLTCGTFLVAAPAASLFSLSASATRSTITLMPLIALLSGYFLWVETFSAVLSGLGRMDQTNVVTALGQGLVVLIAFLLLSRGMGIPALVIAYFSGRGAVNIAVLLLIRRQYKGPLFIKKNLRLAELRTFLRMSGSITGGTILNIFLSPFNKWVIAANLGVSQVPIYEIAFGASMQLRSVLELGLRALVPEISRTNATDVKTATVRIRRLFRKSLLVSAVPGIAMYLTVWVFAYQIFGVWLHKLLAPSQVTAFRILLAGSFVSLLGAPAYYCLIGLQAVKPVFQSYVIQVALNVILVFTLLLTTRISVAEVCVATAMGIVASSVYLIISLETRLGAVSAG